MKNQFSLRCLIVAAMFTCIGVSAAHTEFRSKKGRNRWFGTIGAAIGQETFIGAPRFGIYKEFAWKHGSFQDGYKSSGCYVGVEGSTLVWIGAGIYTVGVNAGVRHQSFTLDNSLSRTIVADTDMQTFAFYNSCNPKIGCRLGPVWIKTGPSIWLSGNADWGRWMKIGSLPVNVEVHYVQRIH
jgi:hypothetical protein